MTNESTLSTDSYSVQDLFTTDMQQQYADYRLVTSIKTSIAFRIADQLRIISKKFSTIYSELRAESPITSSWFHTVSHTGRLSLSLHLFLSRISRDLLQYIANSWMEIISSDSCCRYKLSKTT